MKALKGRPYSIGDFNPRKIKALASYLIGDFNPRKTKASVSYLIGGFNLRSNPLPPPVRLPDVNQRNQADGDVVDPLGSPHSSDGRCF